MEPLKVLEEEEEEQEEAQQQEEDDEQPAPPHQSPAATTALRIKQLPAANLAADGGGGGGAALVSPSAARRRSSGEKPSLSGRPANNMIRPTSRQELTRLGTPALKEECSTEELRFLFNMIDRDGGGTIELEELVELLKRMGALDLSMLEVSAWLNDNDLDNDGVIDFEEFKHAMQNTNPRKYNKRELLKAWQAFDDPVPTGFLHPNKVVEALTEYGTAKTCMTRAEATELVTHFELNEDGLIDYQRALEAMK